MNEPRDQARVTFGEHLLRLPGVILIVGVMADALPFLLGMENSESNSSFTGTKLLIAPAFLLDVVLNAKAYLAKKGILLGCIFAIAGVLLGVGTNVEYVHHLTTLLASLMVFSFAARQRTSAELLFLVRIAFLASLLIPAVQILSHYNILFAEVVVAASVDRRRLFAASNTASFGLYFATISAAFGGILLFRPQLRLLKLLVLVGSPVIGLLSVFSIVIAQQRSGLLSMAIGFLVALALQFRKAGARNLLAIAGSVAIAMFVGYRFVGQTANELDSFSDRIISMLMTETVTESSGGRNEMWLVFADDLKRMDGLIPPGPDYFENIFGMPPHFIIGQAFYNGGWLLMLSATAALFLPGVYVAKAWFRKPGSEEVRLLIIILSAVYCSVLVQALVQPVLYGRIFALLLGFCMSLGAVLKTTRALSGAETAGASNPDGALVEPASPA